MAINDVISALFPFLTTQESGSDTLDSDTSSRVAPPRLEKKKRTVSRDNILKQAETILNDVGNSKALLGMYNHVVCLNPIKKYV